MLPSHPNRVDLHLPFITLLKIIVAIAITAALIRLAPILMLLMLSVLIAITLFPVMTWLEKKGFPRWLAFGIIVIAVLGSSVASVLILLPRMLQQVGTFPEIYTPIQKDMLTKFPDGWAHNSLSKFFRDPQSYFGNFSQQLIAFTTAAMGGLVNVGVVLIIALYLLLDGPRAYAWFIAFFAPETRRKLDQTGAEIAKVVFAYVAGQVITSVLVAIYVLILLSILKVPAALTIAAIAALFDVLPVIGFIASVACALLMALSVSSSVALMVLAGFVVYHLVENYLIVPKIYGNRMRLTTLVVLLALLLSLELLGIVGALLVLPVVASYPIIERIWLRRQLGSETLDKHAVQDA